MSRLTFRPLVAGLSLAVAAAGFGMTAHAAPAPAADAKTAQSAQSAQGAEPGFHRKHHGEFKHGRHGHHGKRHAMMRDAVMIPGLGPLPKPVVDSLNLTEAQQAQVQAARDAQAELRKSLREGGQSRHQALSAQIEAGKLDPRALLEERGKGREAFRKQADEVQQKWLAVWDGLNDAQRDQVAQHLKERQAKIAEFKAKREQRKQGEPGRKAPAAQPAG